MRGYNVNPILLLANFKARENNATEMTVPEQTTTGRENTETPEKEQMEPTRKPQVALAQHEGVLIHGNNAIQPGTAWMVVSVLLLVLIVLMVLDARSRVTRLEAILFEMLRERG